uniref:calcyphosin-2-like n=1 Tax=Styela clava TaxID=7725 RepID=UPI0019395A54|nr:calcyphosin-2-like [Styela clava]
MAAYRSHDRPESVPALNLGHLGTDIPESNNQVKNPVKTNQRLQTPDSRSTVSWGTGLSTPYHVSKQDLQFGGTVHRPCTHMRHKGQEMKQPQKNININEERMNLKNQQPAVEEFRAKSKDHNADSKQKYDKYDKNAERQKEQSRFEQIKHVEKRNDHIKPKGKGQSAYWYLDKELQDHPPTPKVDDTPTIDDLAHMQADYTGQSYTDIHSARKYAAEDDLTNKQKQRVMEQVLVDLLSRHVISDPDQDKDPARSNPADPLRQQPGMPMQPVRNRSRRLHDTKISTVGAVTETSLKSRVTFSARILTQNGRDALRELFGFFFHHDNTVTVYEYRNFGKNNFKALPFISRGKYKHQNGRRKGKDVSSHDIELGKNLAFTTSSLSHLPETIKKSKFVTIRISGIDDSNSGGDCGWNMSTDDRDLDTDARRERQDREVMRKIQSFVREKLRSRSVSVLMGLGQLFRTMDKSGDGLLSKSELADALEQFGIAIPQENFDSVWRVVDENNDGAIDYGEFMRAFIGEMGEFRKQIVRKVFRKLDPHKTGSASLLDMKKMYSARKHPLVASGQLTQEEMEIRFIDSFNQGYSVDPGRVSYVEFEEYYEGLSIVITSDNDFSNMMRNCWGV